MAAVLTGSGHHDCASSNSHVFLTKYYESNAAYSGGAVLHMAFTAVLHGRGRSGTMSTPTGSQGASMNVLLVPNQRRAGVGKRPATENRRAWLPQQARFCPVLEDGSKTGYLVYPPLHDHEALQVRYLPQNVFRFSFFVEDAQRMAHRVFVVDRHPSAGTGGLDEQEVVFLDEAAPLDQAGVLAMVDALTTNVNSPPGGVGLRGAFDFMTPEGWDTIFTGVLNEQQRPHLPSLTVRVETDWYPQNTEFRYVL